MILPSNIRESSQSDIQRKVPIFQYTQCLTFTCFCWKASKETVYNWLLKMSHWYFSSDSVLSFLTWYPSIVKMQVPIVRYTKWANTALCTISEAHLKHKWFGSSYPWKPSEYITQFRGYCSILWLLIDPWSQHTMKKWLDPHSFMKIEVPYPALHRTKVFSSCDIEI